ncbi:hypothetical protein MIZ03_0668 [Rhodoferax lithotrophicus]|uniref:Transposase n=1 Tax=Rhodoferax lithotrophicus TaxID=2798804 RepID=A0ABN6D4S1_9BURK|nr:hypothetical protein MIZ03_0668 [Rhodoferax sp. MIZ03]
MKAVRKGGLKTIRDQLPSSMHDSQQGKSTMNWRDFNFAQT